MTLPWATTAKGDLARLSEIGRELGYSVRAIGPVVNGEDVLSSSLIRQRISAWSMSPTQPKTWAVSML
jgi:FAD synthase